MWEQELKSATRSDPGDDLDPGLVHRLEALSLLLRILVWDGADEVVAPAVLVDLVRVPLDDDLVHQRAAERLPRVSLHSRVGRTPRWPPAQQPPRRRADAWTFAQPLPMPWYETSSWREYPLNA